MANTQTTLAFYSLTLEPSSATQSACTTNAIPTAKRQDQQILEARGSRLLLHRIVENEDRSEVKLQTVAEQDCFGIIRGVSACRIPGTGTDQLIVSSDSGRLVMLNYDEKTPGGGFKRVHQETFGKSGVRRTVPGQYLASDPRGRCCMLASVEKNKVVYIVNRNAEGGILISSPHEANQWGSLCFALCALDTGWEHPVFATLEVDYNEAESDPSGMMYEQREKMLVYYTVDLGLNHVVKTWSDTVDYSANKVFALPGGQDGPSGVLVCCEDRIYYRHDKNPALCIPIPRRKGALEDPGRKRCIVSGCLHLAKARHEFFFLLQTEDGDVFKLTMEMEKDAQGRQTAQPSKMSLRYYETFPVAKEMLLIRKGYIYIAAEDGANKLYHVNDLAEDAAVEPWNVFASEGVSADIEETEYEPTYFKPRGLLYTSLALDISTLNPLMRTKVDNPLNEETPQIYAIQGTGANSCFKTIRHGLEIQEIVSSPLGNFQYDNLWSLKHRVGDPYDSYLVLSSEFMEKTTVLGIGDEVETLEDTQFLTMRSTVLAATMGEDTLVQVHQRGVRSLLSNGKVNEWPSPGGLRITAASANQRQLLLALSSAELAFFFMGDDGVLNGLEEMPEMSGKVTAVGVGKTREGQSQAKWAVVGADDNTIRVLSIEVDTPLEQRSVQALSAVPTSIEVVEQVDPASGTTVSFAHIGLQSGLYLRAVIDEVTGELGDVRTKFLGAYRSAIFPAGVNGQEAVLATASRSWLGYNHPVTSVYTLAPIVGRRFSAARGFVTEHIRGMCGIEGSNLVIFTVPNLEGRLSGSEIGLKYTPRAMSRHPWSAYWYVVQSEGNALSEGTKKGLLSNGADGTNGEAMTADGEGGEEEETTHGGQAQPPEELEKHLGLPRAMGHWASCISIVDPAGQNAVLQSIEFEQNEAALCCVVVQFASKSENEVYLAVGTGQHMQPGSGVESKGFVQIWRLVGQGEGMEFVHKTEFSSPIYAILPFQGRLAIGVGNELLIYDLGLKALLRKSRALAVPNQVTSLQAMGNRIVCADVSESVTYVVFKSKHNRLIPFVDDTVQRWTTTSAVVDYETVGGGDKFGNLWVVRCPEQASKEADEEGIGGFIVNERSYLGGAPYRLDLLAHFYCQDIPMSMQRTALVAGGQEVLFWSGLQGTLGILVPFVSREDVEFFTQLEGLIRNEEPPLAGRDHLMYRSYYVPVKAVIDGDLCERFMRLGFEGKQKISGEVDRSVKEIERKVQEMRTRVAF